MVRESTQIEAKLDIQVDRSGAEQWVAEDEVSTVIANEEATAMTGLKMIRGQGTAIEMTPLEMAEIKAAAESERQSLGSAA